MMVDIINLDSILQKKKSTFTKLTGGNNLILQQEMKMTDAKQSELHISAKSKATVGSGFSCLAKIFDDFNLQQSWERFHPMVPALKNIFNKNVHDNI